MQTAWTRPGTRLGFWLHFSTMSATTSFGVLWGLPYLVNGLGFTTTQASETLLLGVLVVVTAHRWSACSPAAIRPRVPLGIGICLTSMAGWFTVLALPPDRVPDAVVVALVAVMAVGAPASAAAFALARDYNRPDIVGTASGVVNVGGFSAVIAASLLMGVILDVAGSGPGGYRLAMLALFLVQLVGTLAARALVAGGARRRPHRTGPRRPRPRPSARPPLGSRLVRGGPSLIRVCTCASDPVAILCRRTGPGNRAGPDPVTIEVR